MESMLWSAVIFLIVVIIVLLCKIHFMQKAAEEIREKFNEQLERDTNLLIDISSNDKRMKNLAIDLNKQLKAIRTQRHKYAQGDLELKDAVTNISHDLRTPLTAICGYLDLLEREEQTDKSLRYISVIRSRTDILKRLTEELFRYSVFATKSEAMDLEEVTLNSALEESLSAYYTALVEANISPQVSLPEVKIKRWLNKDALSRIFGNIISNAVKYSDGDLNITLTEDGKIVFSNTSANLNEVEVGKLFNRFYTVETAQKSTGLGLSIAKILTEKMKGTIGAEYQNGMIVITVCFPK